MASHPSIAQDDGPVPEVPRFRDIRPLSGWAWGPLLLALVLASCGPPASWDEVPLGRARAERLSGVMVRTRGRVVLLMPDDTVGVPHQHLLIEVEEGFTVKVVHNLDLSRRVPAVVGDTIEVLGEYVYNDKGGLVHWTHADPAGRHPGGWVRLRGRTYD